MTSPGFDPFDPATIADPFPVYRRLRDQDPAHRMRLGERTIWVITRHEHVAPLVSAADMLMRPPGVTSPPELGEGPATLLWRNLMVLNDPPTHGRIRRLASKAFTPRAMEELRPRIEAVVAECLDAVAAKGEMDVVADLAFLVPLKVICGMLGIPEANHTELLEWTPDFFRVFLPEAQDAAGVAACHRASGNFIRVLSGLIEERRRDPRDDLLSALIAVEEGGDRLTRDELVATVLSLLTGGFDTTMGLISGGIQLLLRQPDVLERLRAEPALVDAAVEEFLRLESPVQTTLRYPGVDVEVAGETIRAGERLWLVIASANRDERVFPDPERVLLEGRAEHIAFGGGRHFCIGAHLARIEGTVAIRRFVERIRDPVPIEADPPRRPQLQFRALSRLPIRFRA